MNIWAHWPKHSLLLDICSLGKNGDWINHLCPWSLEVGRSQRESESWGSKKGFFRETQLELWVSLVWKGHTREKHSGCWEETKRPYSFLPVKPRPSDTPATKPQGNPEQSEHCWSVGNLKEECAELITGLRFHFMPFLHKPFIIFIAATVHYHVPVLHILEQGYGSNFKYGI